MGENKGQLYQFSREKRIDHALLLHCDLLQEIGLAYGKSGVALYFYLKAKAENNQIYRTTADTLLDDVMEEFTLDTSIDFIKGITGIGWVVEFLIQQGFVLADRDEVLEEIDVQVEKNINNCEHDIKLLCSLLLYYQARLVKRQKNESIVLHLSKCWLYLMEVLKSELKKNPVIQEDLSEFHFIIPEIWILILIRNMKKDSIVYDSWKLMEEVECLLVSRIEKSLECSTVHICNRIICQLILQQSVSYNQKEIIDALNTVDLKTGMAGFILLAVLIDYNNVKNIVSQIDIKMLEFEKTVTNPQAGYTFQEVNDNEKFGLLSGLSGVGLAHYFVKNGTTGIL